MSTQRDTDLLLRQWLDASAPTSAPERLLESALRRTAHTRPRSGWLASLIGESLPDAHGRTGRQVLTFALAAAVVTTLAVIGIGLANLARVGQTNPTPAPTFRQIDWRGPVPRVPGEAAMIPLLPFSENADEPALTGPPEVSEPWIDIRDVLIVPDGRLQWSIQLAESPPRASSLDPDETLIAYGLVLENTGDQSADWVIGISNSAPASRGFRVWVTNLGTGQTDEKVGGPYGFPIEFSHPDEWQPNDGPPTNQVLFTFLPGSRPSGLVGRLRYYAWASQTRGSEVIAWDYEPSFGWPSAASPEPDATPAAVPPSMPPSGDINGWPGTGSNAASLYSWDGTTCSSAYCNVGWMHNGYASGDVSITMNLLPGAVLSGEKATVAGRDGFHQQVTEGEELWLVDIDGHIVAVKIRAKTGTSESDLAEARAIVDSIVVDPRDTSLGFRLVFTLASDDWDSG